MQPTMKTILLLACCCLVVCLTGCPKSKYPLSDPNKDEIDQSLIGTWVSSKTDEYGTNRTSTVTFSTEDGLPKGVLKATRILDNTGGLDVVGGKMPPSHSTDICFVIPTIVDDVRYYSMPSDTWKPDMGWKPELIKGYYILKYKVRDGKLIEYYPGNGATVRLAAAVKNGDIRGRIEGDDTLIDGPDVIITEPTEGLRKYVQENEAWIYTEKMEYTKR